MLIDHDLTPFYHWLMIFPIGFNIFIYIVKEIVLDFQRGSTDILINK